MSVLKGTIGRPLHSYSFRMGLEASILFDREGSGFLGISVFFFSGDLG